MTPRMGPHRDDLEAALARIDALEGELEHERSLADDARLETDEAKRELAVARRAANAYPRTKLTREQRRLITARQREHDGSSFMIVLGLGIAIAIIGGGWSLFARAVPGHDPHPGDVFVVIGGLLIACGVVGLVDAQHK